MSRINILGVKIDNVTMDEAIARVEEMLTDGKKHQVVTPNPEFVMLAQKDQGFKQILNQADLAIPDGIGLVWASKVLGCPSTSLGAGRGQAAPRLRSGQAGDGILGERVTGTDLMLKLCKRAAEKGWTVFLLGGEGGVAEKVKGELEQRYSGVKIVGMYEGHPKLEFDEEAIAAIKTSSCNDSIAQSLNRSIDLLFVAYGAPTQEKWIDRNLPEISAKVAIGIGGAFDFIVGKQKRAPIFVRRLGLEWFWRLVKQPWRARRQFVLLKFVALVFCQKIKQMI